MELLKVFGIILSFSIVNIASVLAYNRSIIHNVGGFNELYSGVVRRGVELIYSFDLPDDFDPMHTKVRVNLKTNEGTKNKFPLLVTILQTHEPTSLTLPVTMRTSDGNVVRHLHASRTLCIHADHFDEDEQYFEIRIATSYSSMVHFDLEVLKVEAMALGINIPVTIAVSPTTPDFFYFQFPKTDGERHIKVKITSPYEKCAILSIQPALCPVPDHAENVRVAVNQIEHSTGWEWETVTTKGAIVTSNKLISTPGFFVALLVTKDDRQCGHLTESSSRTINMTTEFTLVLTNDQLVDMENVFWSLPVYFPIALNLGILLICGAVCIVIQVCCTGKRNREGFVSLKKFTVVSVSDFNEDFNRKYGERKIPHTYFGKMIIIIAMFFAIPVFELTTYNVTVLHTTGDNDICYYNSLCAHPFGYLKDFNHLWSNMGYVTFGIGFICITYLKGKCISTARRNETSNNIEMGIPFKTGLYYAMGLALVMEGVMSAAYHIYIPEIWARMEYSQFWHCSPFSAQLTLTIWNFDFATLLLHYLIANLSYYLLHYVLVKFVHREFAVNCRSLQPLLYLVLTCVVSVVSMFYFKVDLTEWRKSAAYSREGNGECILWNFYDEHDIWHMYSAVAIFFLYMTLLTMDDGVQNIRQDQLKLI
ncbi:hypothetical protein HA402_005829 [Bradysia odoriphaga]|nr:hypothetical protein HA402_005829 [Bradysia odoriphaga]